MNSSAGLLKGTGTLSDTATRRSEAVRLELDAAGLIVTGADLDKPQRWPLADIESPGPSSYLSQMVRRVSAPHIGVKIDSTFLYDALAERAPGVAVRADQVPSQSRDWKANERMWQYQSLNLRRILWIGPREQVKNYHHLMHDRYTRLPIYFVILGGALLYLWWAK